MKTAKQIMKGKRFIKGQMDSRLPREQSDLLWEKATERLDVILKQYADLPKGVRMHTDNYIFPAAAIYLDAKGAVPADKAYEIIEAAASSNSADAGRKLAKMMKIPGMRSLFLWIWDPMTRKCSERTADSKMCSSAFHKAKLVVLGNSKVLVGRK